MKRRTGFVSNSSSSSFICLFKNNTDDILSLHEWLLENLEVLASNKYKKYTYSDSGYELVDLIPSIESHMEEYKSLYSWSKVEPNGYFKVYIDGNGLFCHSVKFDIFDNVELIKDI